jgi:hypothetical protein
MKISWIERKPTIDRDTKRIGLLLATEILVSSTNLSLRDLEKKTPSPIF